MEEIQQAIPKIDAKSTYVDLKGSNSAEYEFILDGSVDKLQQRNKEQLASTIQSVIDIPHNLVNSILSTLPTTFTIIIGGLLLLNIIHLFLSKILVKYGSYDRKEYMKAVKTVQLFTHYKKFQRKLKVVVWRNRWSNGKELSEALQKIAESSYNSNSFYQFELMNLILGNLTIVKPLKKEAISDISKKIDYLNHNYWSVEF